MVRPREEHKGRIRAEYGENIGGELGAGEAEEDERRHSGKQQKKRVIVFSLAEILKMQVQGRGNKNRPGKKTSCEHLNIKIERLPVTGFAGKKAGYVALDEKCLQVIVVAQGHDDIPGKRYDKKNSRAGDYVPVQDEVPLLCFQ